MAAVEVLEIPEFEGTTRIGTSVWSLLVQPLRSFVRAGHSPSGARRACA